MHIILECVVGSTLHRAAVNDGLEDLDLMAIGIEPPEHVLTIRAAPNVVQRAHYDVYVERSKPTGVRSEAGDTDRVVYGLRKWAALACKGNPSVLLPLFATQEYVHVCEPAGNMLRNYLGKHILGKRAIYKSFSGYMRQQTQRLLGDKGGKRSTRPELIEKYGYDTKYAAHIIRLGFQGQELLQRGVITFGEEIGAVIRAVRTGAWTLERVKEAAEAWQRTLKCAYDHSPLPEYPNYKLVDNTIRVTYLQAWQQMRREK